MLILFFKEMMTWMPGLSLIFYGLALFSVSKYTFKELAGLGLLHLVLGLASILFPIWGLIFWAIGFGLGHIGYGLFLYKKYEQLNPSLQASTKFLTVGSDWALLRYLPSTKILILMP